MRRSAVGGFAAIVLLAQAPQAHADAVLPFLPTIILVWPAAWLLVFPVILLEAIVARKVLRLSLWRAFRVAGLANLASTIVGIPLAWLGVFVLELLGVLAVNQFSSIDLRWLIIAMLPAVISPPRTAMAIAPAVLALFVPFFFASVWIEARVAKHLLPPGQGATVWRWSWQANLLSYALILLLVACLLLMSASPAVRP